MLVVKLQQRTMLMAGSDRNAPVNTENYEMINVEEE